MRVFHFFYFPILLATMGILLGFFWGGFQSLSLILMLSILETSLSFDNAIINAKVLQKMSPVWQRRFLVWGIFIAVFVVRLILPVVIVAIMTRLEPLTVLNMAITDSARYAEHLHQAHVPLSTFGGMFLLMVFLTFIFDAKRSLHWLGSVEKKLSELGYIKAIGIIIALLVLVLMQSLVPSEQRIAVIVPGIIGITLFVILATITDFLHKNQNVASQGLMAFLYLEILDASFSFDGVMAAFAMSKDIVIIMIGLAIGAIFVRSMTIFLVQKGTLNKYRYLEHGAHYAIGALAILMLMSTVAKIPEILTGIIGVTLIGLSFISSLLHNRKVKR